MEHILNKPKDQIPQKQIDIDEFIKLLTCPLTCKIFNEPILASDGVVYEEQAFLLSLSGNKNLNRSYYHVKPLKSLIESFIDRYPEYRKKQYLPDANIKLEKHHTIHHKDIIKFINSNDYNKIKQYIDFDFKLFEQDPGYLDHLLKNAPDDVLKYMIDNTIDLNEPVDKRGWSLLNFMCNGISNKKPDIIIYMINKGADVLHCCQSDNWYPLHQVIHFSKNMQLIKFVLDKHLEKGGNVYLANKDGTSIIRMLFTYCDKEVIMHTLTRIDSSQQTFKDHVETLSYTLNDNNHLSEGDRDNIVDTIMVLATS
jgi:hypothetical protein